MIRKILSVTAGLIVVAFVIATTVSGANGREGLRAVSSTGLVPLCQMGKDQTYKGQDGSLYGNGQNDPPPAHTDAARRELARIQPLDTEGKPSPDGKIVLMSIGMSNTKMEFGAFQELARNDPNKSDKVVVINAAIGGMDVAAWAQSRKTQWGTAWEGAERRLKEANVTTNQVQVIWLKQAKINPAGSGEFPAHARKLADGILKILQMAKERYPNLCIAYLSSRIYGGYATIGLNPEPYAYESAFSVRWLIQGQIRGDSELNYDPTKGVVKCPLLLWGPYLWADGVKPRESDGLTWLREDLAQDGTHPSQNSGTDKVAKLLLKFFRTNPFARTWYLSASDSGFVSLFDGKTLNGWIQKNGTATYRVEDGTIVGKTKEGSWNSFLCTEKEYGDFELEFDVKVDSGLNSGVQIRSKTRDKTVGKGPNNAIGRVIGPQVEIESSGKNGAESGYIYNEATGQGWLTPEDRLIPHKHFQDGQWNHYRVLAQGPRIRTWINGISIEDLIDNKAYEEYPKGFIGLQVHRIREGAGPYEVRWRNIRIRELERTEN